MDDTPTAIINIKRTSQFMSSIRKYEVVIDGQRRGAIDDGGEENFRVQPGKHTLFLKLDWYKSQILNLDLQAGETIHLACGTHIEGRVLTWSMLLLYLPLLFMPDKWVYVKIADDLLTHPAKLSEPIEQVSHVSEVAVAIPKWRLFVAILFGQLAVNLPSFIITLAIGIVGFIFTPKFGWLFLPVGFVLGTLWWAGIVPHWRKWALGLGIPPQVLRKYATLTGLNGPQGGIFQDGEFKVEK